MKQTYEEAQLEIIAFSEEDVLTASDRYEGERFQVE